MQRDELEDLELDLLLEAVYQRYGYDFRRYARGSLRRRIGKRLMDERVSSISALQDRLLRDPGAMDRLLLELSINVTSMFRDPSYFATLRKKVVPVLRTYPFVRVWNAGCASGEETYSLAILLEEEGIYDRTRIYATDINELVLDHAKEGVFSLDKMRSYTYNYIKSGGKQAFSEYYTADANGARFDPALTRNVVFAQHNLVSDGSFNEFHLIVCRNVMIYFDKELQDQVHALFHRSLANFGILTLGKKEDVRFSSFEDRYEPIDEEERIYRKVS